MLDDNDEGSFRLAWVLLCAALAVHVADEALTGFLSVYNPTVLAIRSKGMWFPAPTFTFRNWLAGLIVACVVLLILSGWATRKHRAMVIAAYIFAAIMLLNAAAHTGGTVMGHTLGGVRFPRPMPGFYSSPLLVAAAVYLLISVRRKKVMTQAA
jgi:high-affinity Fe2+/Pb2+ permease